MPEESKELRRDPSTGLPALPSLASQKSNPWGLGPKGILALLALCGWALTQYLQAAGFMTPEFANWYLPIMWICLAPCVWELLSGKPRALRISCAAVMPLFVIAPLGLIGFHSNRSLALRPTHGQSNKQIAITAKSLGMELRKLQSDYQTRMATMQARHQREQDLDFRRNGLNENLTPEDLESRNRRWADARAEESTLWPSTRNEYNSTFKSAAIAVREEILERLSGERYSKQSVSAGFSYSTLTNIFSLDKVATDLERLSVLIGQLQ